MKSVDRNTRAQIERLHGGIDEAARAVREAHANLSEGIAELFGPLEEAVGTYNEQVADYNDLLDDVIGRIDGFLDGKSQRWHDAEKGTPWLSWKDELDGKRLEAVEVPDMPHVPDPYVVQPEELPSLTVEDWE